MNLRNVMGCRGLDSWNKRRTLVEKVLNLHKILISWEENCARSYFVFNIITILKLHTYVLADRRFRAESLGTKLKSWRGHNSFWWLNKKKKNQNLERIYKTKCKRFGSEEETFILKGLCTPLQDKSLLGLLKCYVLRLHAREQTKTESVDKPIS